MFHSCLISSKFIYTISFPILSCLYDNKPPFAQMCCNSCLFLCAELLEGPHTEKLHLSSPLPLSHQLQKRAKRALHNRVIPQESANPALIIMKSFFFFFLKRKMLSCCSVDMQLTQDRQKLAHCKLSWSWLQLYHVWPRKPISGFHPSLVELPRSQKNFLEESKTRALSVGMCGFWEGTISEEN